MQSLAMTKDLIEEIEVLLKRIPFFKQLHDESYAQFQRIIHLAEIIEAAPSEYILEKGEKNDGVYFLLKGQLNVLLEESDEGATLNQILPGEMFGIISMMTEETRSAWVKTSSTHKKHLIFKLNNEFISGISRHSQLTLDMQIRFYRFALDNILWLLEQHKMALPDPDLMRELRKVRFSSATNNHDQAALESLKQQCKEMSNFVVRWNQRRLHSASVSNLAQ